MNDADRAAIRARLDAATKGPWHYRRPEDGVTHELTRTIWARVMDGPDGMVPVAQSLSLHDVPEGEGFLQEQAVANAEFIAHAPTDLAALLDENERLRKALAVYADLNHWFDDDSRSGCVFDYDGRGDGGSVARAALAGREGDTHASA